MIVVCPSCSARFQYDEARFLGAPHKRFRCPKCTHVFEVPNPTELVPAVLAEPEAVQPQPPPPPPRVFSGGPHGTSAIPIASMMDTTSHGDLSSKLAKAQLATELPSDLRFSLAFLSGPHSSTVRPITAPQTVIGREEGDILTQDPECSRRHCRVDIYANGTVWLVDLGSTNGTFVDKVQIFGTVQLTDRQEFTCGRSTFMLLVRTDDPHLMM